MPDYLIFPTYLVVWFITMFMIIPIGLRQPEERDPMHYAGAPENPQWLRKILWNTVLAGVVTAAIWGVFALVVASD